MLFLVGTPIGNLGDITARALETLRAVPIIIVEKYTDSVKLLRHFDIRDKKILSFDDRNAKRALPGLRQALLHNDAAYIVSAGMPGISDPCSLLVNACREDAIPIVSIPGPSAVTTAIALSGFFDRAFLFVGFLPKKPTQLKKTLEEARENNHLLVFFESTHRILKTLAFLGAEYPDTRLFIGKELTKAFERSLVGSPAELLEQFAADKKLAKGEFTCVIALQ
ncbi:16S rRNA (cytidine(1402)-2'-O)-methyltransferase [Candidatus Uhrbacteria bacterium]|nr:16S rRNA (cytidine(1402)-2'-O)-methyltransferase [Candidatus Uhrbacteria bacterium]